MKVVRFITALAITFFAFTTVWGQSFLPSLASRSPIDGTFASGINVAPSNPVAMPVAYGGPAQGSAIIPFTRGMLGAYMPTIPNLELGFQYYFGNKVSSGQASADYVLPYNLGNDAVVFGEAHGNYWNFAQKPAGGASNRVDLSVGGGYRKIVSDQLLLGINGFYDTSRLFNNWHSSAGVGLEMAANMGSSDAVDLNANWYGDLFASNSIINAFRNQGSSYDIEAGYSHALFNQAMDLRLKFAGYKFDVGNSVYGYKTGADLTTRDGMFTLRYEYGNDKINGSWNNLGAFVNIGFQIENIGKGESPFAAPEPIFKSPRNLRRMLTQKVRRDWNQQYAPGRGALASAAVSSLCRSIADGTTNYTGNFTTPFVGSELDPALYTLVTFTYLSNTANFVSIDFFSTNGWFYSHGDSIENDDTAHTVTWQIENIDLMGEPDIIGIGFSSEDDTDVRITNVTVCFNRPGAP